MTVQIPATDIDSAVQLIVAEANAFQGIIDGGATDPNVVTPAGASVPPVLKVFAAIQASANAILDPVTGAVAMQIAPAVAAATAAELSAQAAAAASGPVYAFYDTYNASGNKALADLANIPANAYIEISADETHANARDRYQKVSGALVFRVNLDQLRLDIANGLATQVLTTIRLAVNEGNNRGFEIRTRSSVTGYSVPYYRATTLNTQTAVDVMPNGTPSVPTNGPISWTDFCSVDCSDTNPAINSTRVAQRADAGIVGTETFNGASAQPLYLVMNGSPELTLSVNGTVVCGPNGATSGAVYSNYQTFDCTGGVTTKGGVWQSSSSDHSITGYIVLDNASFRFQSQQSQPAILGSNLLSTLLVNSVGDVGVNQASPQHAAGFTTVHITGATTTTGGQIRLDTSDASRKLFVGVDSTNGARIFATVDPINLNVTSGVGLSVAQGGNVRVGDATAPTSRMHLKAGTATANTAPLQFDSGTLETVARAGTAEYDGNFRHTKSGNVRFGVGGTLFSHFADAGNATTVETDLFSDSILANTLDVNGAAIQIRTVGSVVGSTSTKQFRRYFGGTLVFDSGALAVTSGASWEMVTTIHRDSSSSVRVAVAFSVTGVAVPASPTYTAVAGLTLTGALTSKVTGTAAATGAANNDIVAKAEKTTYQAP